MPIATGEMLYTKYEFRDLLVRERGRHHPARHLLRRRPAGAEEDRRDGRGVTTSTVAPHNPMGPVATAVNVHFAACTPNFLILEYHPDDQAPAPRPDRRADEAGRRLPRAADQARASGST